MSVHVVPWACKEPPPPGRHQLMVQRMDGWMFWATIWGGTSPLPLTDHQAACSLFPKQHRGKGGACCGMGNHGPLFRRLQKPTVLSIPSWTVCLCRAPESQLGNQLAFSRSDPSAWVTL